MGKDIVVTYTKSVIRQILTDGNSVSIISNLVTSDDSRRGETANKSYLIDGLTAEERAIWDAWWAMWQGKANLKDGVA